MDEFTEQRCPGPFRDGKVHVLADMCETCVFRPGNLMRLETGRLAEMVRENLARDVGFACHNTLPYGPYEDVEQAVCRGFFDRYHGQVTPLKLAILFGIIVEDPVPRRRD